MLLGEGHCDVFPLQSTPQVKAQLPSSATACYALAVSADGKVCMLVHTGEGRGGEDELEIKISILIGHFVLP